MIFTSCITTNVFAYETDNDRLSIQQQTRNLLSNTSFHRWLHCDKVQNVIVENGKKLGLKSLAKLYDTDTFEKLKNPEYYYQMIFLDLLCGENEIEKLIKISDEIYENNYTKAQSIVKDLGLDSNEDINKAGDALGELTEKFQNTFNLTNDIFDKIDKITKIGDWVSQAIKLSTLDEVTNSTCESVMDIGEEAEKRGKFYIKFAADAVIKMINTVKNKGIVDKTLFYEEKFYENFYYYFMQLF